VVAGDLNARTGRVESERMIGRHGEHIANNNGQALRDFTAMNDLKITNSFFPHKEIQPEVADQ
jgi:hypothetical protein